MEAVKVEPGPPPLIALDNTKAGMEGVDKSFVERTIEEISVGTPFYVNEQRKAAVRAKRHATILSKLDDFRSGRVPPTVRGRCIRESKAYWHTMDEAAFGADSTLVSLSTTRSSSCPPVPFGVYVHFDMDMFFAAVEERRNPALHDVPFGVGGMGMLSTSNYVARLFGVRAGMPGYIGKRLCPELVIVPPSYGSYVEASEKVKCVLRRYDPNLTSAGLDEACVNLGPFLETMEGSTQGSTSTVSLLSRLQIADEVARRIRAEIQVATDGLTASCGIAITPCLAKIVSNYSKPNGQYLLPAIDRSSVAEFVRDLPVRRVPGVGKVSEQLLLECFQVRTCGQIAAVRHLMWWALPKKTVEFYFQVGLGISGAFVSAPSNEGGGPPEAGLHEREDEDVEGDEVAHVEAGDEAASTTAAAAKTDGEATSDSRRHSRKSISHERTFRPCLFAHELMDIAERNLRQSWETLREEKLLCRQLTVKVKRVTFDVHQVSTPLWDEATDDFEHLRKSLIDVMEPLLAECTKFRLLGVRLGALQQASSHVQAARVASTTRGGQEQEGSGLRRLDDWLSKKTTAAPVTSAKLNEKGRGDRSKVVEVMDLVSRDSSAEELRAQLREEGDVVEAESSFNPRKKRERTDSDCDRTAAVVAHTAPHAVSVERDAVIVSDDDDDANDVVVLSL